MTEKIYNFPELAEELRRVVEDTQKLLYLSSRDSDVIWNHFLHELQRVESMYLFTGRKLTRDADCVRQTPL